MAEERYRTESGGVLCACQHCDSNKCVHPPKSRGTCHSGNGYNTNTIDSIRVAHGLDATSCLIGGKYSCSSPDCPKVREKIASWEAKNSALFPEHETVGTWTPELVLKHGLQARFSTWTAEYISTLPTSVQRKYNISVFGKGAVLPDLAEKLLTTVSAICQTILSFLMQKINSTFTLTHTCAY